LAALTVHARRVPANAQIAIEFGFIRLPRFRLGLCNTLGMLDEFRKILFTNWSFRDAAKYVSQIFHRFWRMLPIVLPHRQAMGAGRAYASRVPSITLGAAAKTW
jgi:hypothetical protein